MEATEYIAMLESLQEEVIDIQTRLYELEDKIKGAIMLTKNERGKKDSKRT